MKQEEEHKCECPWCHDLHKQSLEPDLKVSIENCVCPYCGDCHPKHKPNED